jgi:hypothetical protein
VVGLIGTLVVLLPLFLCISVFVGLLQLRPTFSCILHDGIDAAGATCAYSKLHELVMLPPLPDNSGEHGMRMAARFS